MKNVVGTYRPDLIECTLFKLKIEGFSPESVVTINKEEATNTVRKAMDGTCSAFC